EGLDADLGEPGQPGHVVGLAPVGEQLRVRVDAHAQPAARRQCRAQPVCPVGRGHRSAAARSEACSSWRERTTMSPRMPASMPCTAAAAPCTVVISAVDEEIAAERISYAVFCLKKWNKLTRPQRTRQ